MDDDVRIALKLLTFRESEVLKLRWGLMTGHRHTLKEVAKVFKVTRERVRQIEAKALRRLRGVPEIIDRFILRGKPMIYPKNAETVVAHEHVTKLEADVERLHGWLRCIRRTASGYPLTGVVHTLTLTIVDHVEDALGGKPSLEDES